MIYTSRVPKHSNPTVRGSGAGKVHTYRAPAIKAAQNDAENALIAGYRDRKNGIPARFPLLSSYMKGYRMI